MKAHVSDVLPEEYKPMRVSCNVNIQKIEYKDLKKEICWLWKTGLYRRKKQEKQDPEDKFLEINYREREQNKSKFYKVTYNKFGKYGHRESGWWGNKNKVNKSKNKIKPRFGG